ncbi:MAG: succinylglutamate desuccinylase [Herminiimonas sp.]|nr:succinylglutamate desuccinylase [Herminiimonas sp.]
MPLPDADLQALAAGDFTDLAHRFAKGGLWVSLPGTGMLQLQAPRPDATRLLISVGVHGNETAPIAMLASVLQGLAQAPMTLAVDLLIVVGNPAAIAQGARFVDADLNRLFCAERGALAASAEAARADALMTASAAFLAAPATQKWHLDLHSAVRPSRYARFAVIPARADDPLQEPLAAWLGSAAIEALLFNSQRAATYSAFTARAFCASSCTVELGQVAILGETVSAPLLTTRLALDRLLRGKPPAAGGPVPVRFRVAQEIIKRSTAFRMNIDDSSHNFTAFAPDMVIATDGEHIISAGAATEYVVFLNPGVPVGQRAGLMVVQADANTPALHREETRTAGQ